MFLFKWPFWSKLISESFNVIRLLKTTKSMNFFIIMTFLSFIQPVIVHLVFLFILSILHMLQDWLSDGSTKINNYNLISSNKPFIWSRFWYSLTNACGNLKTNHYVIKCKFVNKRCDKKIGLSTIHFFFAKF